MISIHDGLSTSQCYQRASRSHGMIPFPTWMMPSISVSNSARRCAASFSFSSVTATCFRDSAACHKIWKSRGHLHIGDFTNPQKATPIIVDGSRPLSCCTFGEGGCNPGNLRTFIAPRTLYDLYGIDTKHIDLRLGQEVVAREGMYRLPHWNAVRIYPHSTTQHLLGPKVMGRNQGKKTINHSFSPTTFLKPRSLAKFNFNSLKSWATRAKTILLIEKGLVHFGSISKLSVTFWRWPRQLHQSRVRLLILSPRLTITSTWWSCVDFSKNYRFEPQKIQWFIQIVWGQSPKMGTEPPWWNPISPWCLGFSLEALGLGGLH